MSIKHRAVIFSDTVNYIDNPSLAKEFCRVVDQFKMEFAGLLKESDYTTPGLKTTYIHFKFDGSNKNPQLKLGKYSTKHKDIDAEISINAEEFRASDAKRINLLYDRVLEALKALQLALPVQNSLKQIEEIIRSNRKK
jgi:hypothetical protein